MNNLTRILYSAQILRLRVDKVAVWKERREVAMLAYALRLGLYDVRLKAVEALGEIESGESVPVLLDALEDKVEKVMLAAATALRRIGTTPEIEAKITATLERRERIKEAIAERRRNKKKYVDIPKWDRPSKKTLENLKQMLKKPMNQGKWL
jgi:HEAT repeat protein